MESSASLYMGSEMMGMQPAASPVTSHGGKNKRPRPDSLSSPGQLSSSGSVGTPELMRCKRRITFNQLGYGLPQAPPAAVARRNERERNRVKLVNMGFATLREHVPNGAKNKKMSKVETLRSAVDYIRQLQQVLVDNSAGGLSLSPYPDSTSSNGSAHEGNENCYPRPAMAQLAPHQSSISPPNSVASSPTPSYASDSSGYEALSPEDEELLDFSTWFS